jgi:hypothetical protein
MKKTTPLRRNGSLAKRNQAKKTLRKKTGRTNHANGRNPKGGNPIRENGKVTKKR